MTSFTEMNMTITEDYGIRNETWDRSILTLQTNDGRICRAKDKTWQWVASLRQCSLMRLSWGHISASPFMDRSPWGQIQGPSLVHLRFSAVVSSAEPLHPPFWNCSLLLAFESPHPPIFYLTGHSSLVCFALFFSTAQLLNLGAL